MANLLKWGKDRAKNIANVAQGAYNQVNPFDGGRTYDTNQRGVDPGSSSGPRFQLTNNSLTRGASRAFDQVNMADNNRTWKQRAPVGANRSAAAQLIDPVKKNLVDPIIATGQKNINQAGAAVTGITGLTQAGYQSIFGSDQDYANKLAETEAAMREILNSGVGGKGGYQNYAQASADNRTLSDYKQNLIKPTAQAVVENAPLVIPMSGAGPGAGIVRKALVGAGENALVGGATTAGQQAIEGRFDPREIIKSAAMAGAIGAAIPTAGAAVKQVPAFIRGLDNMGQEGFIKMPGGGKKGKVVVTDPNTGMPPGYTKAPDGTVRAPNGRELTLGQMQDLNQQVDLSRFERAHNQGDLKMIEALSKKYPDDARFQVDSERIGTKVVVDPVTKEIKVVPDQVKTADGTGSVRFDPATGKIAKESFRTNTAKPDSALGKANSAARRLITPLDEAGAIRPGEIMNSFDRLTGRSKGGKVVQSTDIPGMKKSRFADKTAKRSTEVSPEVQQRIAEVQQATATTSNAKHLAGSEAFLKGKNISQAHTSITETLNKKLGTISDQDVSDAIATAKKLDAKGGTSNFQKATDIYTKLSDHLKKNGQNVQAASLLNNRTPQGMLYGAQKALKNAGVDLTEDMQKNLRGLVDDIKNAKAGSYEDGLARYKLSEFVSKNVPAGAADKGVQLWKAGLLSAPTTTAGNLFANSAEQVYKHGYKDPVAAGVDKIMSVFTGKRTKSFTGRGIAEGAQEGAIKGVKYFKTGYDPRNPLQKFDVHDIHFSDSPAGKAAETYTQSIFKLMGAQDQPFYYASFRNSIADQAVTEAKNAGLKGAQRTEFIKKFITQPAKDVLELADKEARYDVFQNPTALGNLAHGINKGPVGQFLVPFSQVPASVATRMIDRTPIGLGKEILSQIKAGKFDQRAMSTAIADASAGVAMLGAGAALAKSGLITLGFPTDQKERDLWELEGKQPNSVRIGDKWVSLNYIQPLGSIFAAGANYQNALKEGKTKEQAFSAAAGGASKSLTEQSFLKGVSGALQAVNDPQRSAEKFAENTAGSIVPNFIRSATRSLDPVNREQNGIRESVASGVPGLRQRLNPRTDVFGDAVPRKTGAVSSFTNPLRPSDVRQGTDLTGELRRLQNADEGVTATKILKDALGDKAPQLSKQQQYELKNEIGARLKQDWASIIKDPRYQSLSDIDKRQKLEKVRDDITGAYKAKYGAEKNLTQPDPKKLSLNETRVLMSESGGGTKPNYFTGVSKEDQYKYSTNLSQYNLDLDRARGRDDLNTWLTTAQKKYDQLDKLRSSYDPATEQDKINKTTLEMENLTEQANKYQSYGGFTKGGGSKGKKGKKKFRAPSKSSISQLSSTNAFRKLTSNTKLTPRRV